MYKSLLLQFNSIAGSIIDFILYCNIFIYLPAMQETWVQSLGWEDPLEKGTHSSILAWRIPRVIKNQTQLSDFHFHVLQSSSHL